jgi:hypothetical protein
MAPGRIVIAGDHHATFAIGTASAVTCARERISGWMRVP